MKHKYNIGDVVLLNNCIFGKVGIIIGIPEVRYTLYEVLICGEQKSIMFWESDIEEKI